MFTIDSNYNINISRGDDVQFLFTAYANSTSRLVFNSADGCKLYFYVFTPNSEGYEYLLKKTYQTDGTIITTYNAKYRILDTTTTGNTNLDSNGNFIITLTSSDTLNLPVGKQKYQIRGLLIDPNDNSKFVNRTMCNRYDFNIIEDDYSERIW